MVGYRWIALSLLFAATVCGEDPRLHLKGDRRSGPGERSGIDVSARRIKSWRSDRVYHLVQFRTPPTSEDLEGLARRGIVPVRYVPDLGFLLAASPAADLSGLKIGYSTRLRTSEKLSRYVAVQERGGGLMTAVVEFHSDVDAQDAAAVLRAESVELFSTADLLPNQLLVRADSARLRSLSEWEEVAYIFPASKELEDGVPVRACAGALTDYGSVGQYVSRVGEGWDGPGRNRTVLGYFVARLASNLPREEAQASIERALKEWSRHVDVELVPAAGPFDRRTLNILFATGEHGDRLPFEGRGRILAHTFYPAPPNPESIAGDIHFDDDEDWSSGSTTDLFSVTLHEVGHALGLGHSDKPGSVMYPYYRTLGALSAEDVEAIREIYAARETSIEDPQQPPELPSEKPAPPALRLVTQTPASGVLTTTEQSLSVSGTVEGGDGDVRVAWRSSRGYSGSATGSRPWRIQNIPLDQGENSITIEARDASQVVSCLLQVRRAVVSGPPQIRIDAPVSASTYSTTSDAVILSGTATHPDGIARVQWMTSRGFSGDAQGTSQWSAGPVSLLPGINVIKINASTATGSTASASIAVNYSSQTDTVAPWLTIVSPSSVSVLRYGSAIRLSGMARDDGGVAEVSWEHSSGNAGTAHGTNYWSTSDIPLNEGANTITVRARDTAGNMAWRSVVVTRKPR